MNQQKQRDTQQSVLFRKFSRKKYAAFSSLGKTIKISVLTAASTLIVSPIQAQAKTENDTISSKIDLEEVEVVGQKSTVLVDELPRAVELIDAQVIQNAPQQSFQDLIQYSSNIDISQRGQFGIQSDVSIRGGSFDQVLILQNGINLTDPQTGHHNLNLPIDRESIYKIEILNGPAARALGANAYSGAINVVTKPLDYNQVSVTLNGSHSLFLLDQPNYFRGHLGLNLATENTKHLFSGSFSKSDGYIKNTDFKALNFNYHGVYNLPGNSQAITQVGINNKAFGANSYYTPAYPDQFEETSTYFVSAGFKTNGAIKTKTEVYWRRHNDRFELFREDPDYYRFENDLMISDNPTNPSHDTISWYKNHNYHQTDIFGANFNSTYTSKYGKTSIGANTRSENLLSNALGDDMTNPIPVLGADSVYYTKKDNRNSFDVFLEHAYRIDRLFISAGALLHWSNFDANKLNIVPGVDLSVWLTKDLSLVSSYNYTVGQPTFTDLKYQGPTNKGNEKLQPYYQHSIEAGINYKYKDFQVGILDFYTKGKNNIDWVRNDSTNSFLAMNIETSENIGTECYFRYKNTGNRLMDILLHEVYLGYTFINTYRSTPEGISKYSNIRHKAVARIDQKLTTGLTLSWGLMYKQRIGSYLGYNFETNEYTYNAYPNAFLLDLRASYNLKDFTFYIEGSNLFDVQYVESGSIPQPGRWFKGGISYCLKY